MALNESLNCFKSTRFFKKKLKIKIKEIKRKKSACVKTTYLIFLKVLICLYHILENGKEYSHKFKYFL